MPRLRIDHILNQNRGSAVNEMHMEWWMQNRNSISNIRGNRSDFIPVIIFMNFVFKYCYFCCVGCKRYINWFLQKYVISPTSNSSIGYPHFLAVKYIFVTFLLSFCFHSIDIRSATRFSNTVRLCKYNIIIYRCSLVPMFIWIDTKRYGICLQ